MMTTTATATMEPISSRLRHDEKEAFLATCDSIGTSPSNAIRMFVAAFNKRGGFPFDPANPYGFSAETLAAMDDAASGRNLHGPYGTVDEMFAALEED
ncbi:MAG: type II toxin-antitoxin system RelB/DinJ family antitoxin [Eggerthellaceae bacterium]|nr:type II toxin-antitoxin system RelB/DinJ family antitoxin [Eggerthellaceae bacterium]